MMCSCGTQANGQTGQYSQDFEYKSAAPRDYSNFDSKGCVQGVIFFLIVSVIVAITSQGR
jgi:hypothetical protein